MNKAHVDELHAPRAGRRCGYIDAWFAPARTPAAVVDRSHTEVRKAVFQPKLRDYFQVGGYEPQADPPAQCQKIFRADIKRFAQIVRIATVEPR